MEGSSVPRPHKVHQARQYKHSCRGRILGHLPRSSKILHRQGSGESISSSLHDLAIVGAHPCVNTIIGCCEGHPDLRHHRQPGTYQHPPARKPFTGVERFHWANSPSIATPPRVWGVVYLQTQEHYPAAWPCTGPHPLQRRFCTGLSMVCQWNSFEVRAELSANTENSPCAYMDSQ